MLVRPSIFLYMRKTLKTSGKPGRQCQCLFQWPATSYCHQRSGTAQTYQIAMAVCVAGGGGGVCVHAFARGTHVCAFVRDVFAIYDNNI